MKRETTNVKPETGDLFFSRLSATLSGFVYKTYKNTLQALLL